MSVDTNSHISKVGRERFYIPIRDDIAQHSRALIKALEEKLAQEPPHYHVKIGFEKEMFIPSKVSTLEEGGSEVDVTEGDELEEILNGISKTALRKMRQKRMKVKPVIRFDSESAPDTYEIITHVASPLHAIQRMDAQQQCLENFTRRNPVISFGDDTISMKPANFSPVDGEVHDPATAGLHVNFSVWDMNQQNLFSMSNEAGFKSERINAMRRTLHYLMQNDLLLIAPSDEA